MDSYRPGGDGRRAYGASDSYRPGRRDNPPPVWPPSDANAGMFYFQGSHDRDDRNRTGYRPRRGDHNARNGPPHRGPARRNPFNRTAADRPLLRLTHDEADSVSFADTNTESFSKFRNLDELTDSDEEAMAQSEDDEEDQRRSKRARVETTESDVAPAAPKWSNPDPYTSLPPSTDATVKRTDVVKLIRKARIDNARNLENSNHPDDFISFEGNELDSPGASVPPSPPPNAAPVPSEGTADIVLGKRKRGAAVGDKSLGAPSDNKVYADRRVQARWAMKVGIDPTPWLTEHPPTDLPGVALHKEIIDFYEWVKPKYHEEQTRHEVFDRLSRRFRNLVPGELRAFGSYAAGLYLPTADMDLVYLTRNFDPRRPASKAEARQYLPMFAHCLRREHIAKPGSVVVIAKAKVPIIKFVDMISGLKVDLSFENDSGIVAIDTFHRWKKAYPVMPIIVSIVKQFLMIRGLNDVATGGLGGFSTICLVTSLLQHMPPIQQPANLGEVLLEFFNYYGNLFDRRSVIIRLDPPGYLEKKSHLNQFSDRDDERLTIVDPHRSDNNISGGTTSIDEIIKSFSDAHRALLGRLAAYEKRAPDAPVISFLECLIGGNFTPYDIQRRKLYELFQASQPAGQRLPLPPSQLGQRHDSAEDPSSDTSNQPNRPKRANKGERRAQRLKRLRPDLAPSIRKRISMTDALNIGGYNTPESMEKDLQTREAALVRIAAGTAS